MRHLLSVVLLLSVASCARDAGAPAPDPVTVRMVHDDSTGADLPRVTVPGRPEVEARVNASLDSLSRSLHCDGAPASDTSYTSRTSVAHAADGVLSVSVHSQYDCGGPYPTNDANRSVTFDLETGETVPFPALFRDYAADQAAIAGVLETTLSAPGTAVDVSCADMLTRDALAGAEIAYTLTADGVTVQPVFPHVAEACAVVSTIPYGSLRAYAHDGGALARVADATP